MKCPVCGAAELVHDTRPQSYTYKGQTTQIMDVTAHYCPSCGECITDADESARVMQAMLAWQQHVNSQTAEPAYILHVRQKLQLSQKEAGEIFGGGVNAFSRYETGRASPPVALVKLFKLLDRHPEHLAEIR